MTQLSQQTPLARIVYAGDLGAIHFQTPRAQIEHELDLGLEQDFVWTQRCDTENLAVEEGWSGRKETEHKLPVSQCA